MAPWLIFLFGLLVRVGLLLRRPEVHYDEAVNGLMARHVLKGEFPIFFWGQDHAGTLAAYLIAVPFALLDSSVLALHLVPLGFSLLLMILSYRLARVVYDEETARVAMLYAALPPLTLLHFGVTAKDPYAEIPVLGALLLLLALRLVGTDRVDGGRAFVLGLVAGLAWWTQLLLVSYLLAAGVFLLVRRRWAWLLPEGAMGLAGFFLGSVPFWVHNLVEPGESLGLIRGAAGAQLIGNLAEVWRDLPVLLGASTPWPDPTLNRLVGLGIGLVYLPAVGFFVVEGLRALWRRRFLVSGGLLVVTAVAVVAVDVASPYASLGGAKYLFPLYGVLPALLARYTVWLKRVAGVGASLLVMLLILGLHAQEVARDLVNSFEPGYLEEQNRPPTSALADFLRARGISRVYAHFTLSLKLTFDTREKIVAADWYGFRNPRYLEEVERSERVALLTHTGFRLPDPNTLEENLRALGGSFRKQELDGFVVFYDFRPPPRARPLPARQWSGRGLPRAEGSEGAYDRDGESWWGSAEPQRPGLAYEVDLGRVVRLVGLSLHPGPILRGTPRGYRVEVSSDAANWKEVVRVGEALPGLHWSGSHPRLDRSGRIQAAFLPVEGRYVRITQTGRDRRYWWSVGEIFLYEEGPPPEDRAPGRATLAEGEHLEASADWEYIGASPLARAGWRVRKKVDWDRVLGAYARAIQEDPELEEAHHRLAVVLSRLEIPPPGDPRRGAAFERLGAWRTAAEEYERALREPSLSARRSSPWEGRLRTARHTGELERAREVERVLQAEFTPAVRSGVAFGRGLTFQGFRLEPGRVAPGEAIRLTAYWQATRPLQGEPRVVLSFHGRDGTGFRPAPAPVGGVLPLREWVAGETVREELTVSVPPETPPGRYEIRLRVRDGEKGAWLRVWRFGLPTWSRHVRIGEIDVRVSS